MLSHRCFPEDFAKFLRPLILKNMQNASSPTFLNYLRLLNLMFGKILSKIGNEKIELK